MENKENLHQPAAAPAGDVENISKIRDILFGSNMNEYEKRFELLENKLSQSIIENKQELDKKFSAIDFFIKKELNTLNEKLREEEETRENFEKKLLTDTEELGRTFKQFQQAANDSLAEDRNYFKEITNNLNEQISSLKQNLQERIDKNNNQLQTHKVDRSSLAAMLTDLACKIADENDTSAPNNN